MGHRPHSEDPSLPGYTEAGEEAGEDSVLSEGDIGWDVDGWPTWNPWEAAPFHMIDLLRPQLTTIGYAALLDPQSTDVLECLYTNDTEEEETPNQLHTYPGDGVTGFYYAERVLGEGPISPGEMLGWNEMRVTGLYIYLLADGPWVSTKIPFEVVRTHPLRFTDASLNGPSGAVPIQTLDATTVPSEDRWARDFLDAAELIIPLDQLKPNATYHVSATMANSLATLSRSWSFTTGNKVTHWPRPRRAQHSRLL